MGGRCAQQIGSPWKHLDPTSPGRPGETVKSSCLPSTAMLVPGWPLLCWDLKTSFCDLKNLKTENVIGWSHSKFTLWLNQTLLEKSSSWFALFKSLHFIPFPVYTWSPSPCLMVSTTPSFNRLHGCDLWPLPQATPHQLCGGLHRGAVAAAPISIACWSAALFQRPPTKMGSFPSQSRFLWWLPSGNLT